jgi:hypothetical protein
MTATEREIRTPLTRSAAGPDATRPFSATKAFHMPFNERCCASEMY